MSLHEMFADTGFPLLPYVDDCRVNLLAPCQITEEQLSHFHSDLGQVMGWIKYAKDKESLLQWLTNTTSSHYMTREAADVIKTCGGWRSERHTWI